MKKVYIKPNSRTIALRTLQSVLVEHSPYHDLIYTDSRRLDDRFEDYEDYDNDPSDFDNVAFWDE